MKKTNRTLLWICNWTSKIGEILFDYVNSVLLVGLGEASQNAIAIYQSSQVLVNVELNLFGGARADRKSKKRIIVIADVLCGITCFALSFFL